MDWPGLDLGQMFVAAAPYGGPLAVVRDWKQFVKATTSGKPVIKIFTCSGNLLATINVIFKSKFYVSIVVLMLFLHSGTVVIFLQWDGLTPKIYFVCKMMA